MAIGYCRMLPIRRAITALFVFALLSSGVVIGQERATTRALLDSVIAHAKRASQYRDKVDWPTLTQEMHTMAVDADSVPAIAAAVRHLFASLGDEHARLIHDGRAVAYFSGGVKGHMVHFDPAVYDRIQSGVEFAYMATLVDPGVGYVRIVGLPMGDNLAMATAIQAPIDSLRALGAEKWIVDLRYNGGGNMFPMVEGLATVLGDGSAGGVTGYSAAEGGRWKVEHGDFYYDDYSVHLPNNEVPTTLPDVAVLTSMYTVSSGEVVAVAFKGRPNTRFFGEPTGGMVTATDWTQFDPRTALMISVGNYTDRNGKVYTDFVDVDEAISFIPGQPLKSDSTVLRAITWLRDKR